MHSYLKVVFLVCCTFLLSLSLQAENQIKYLAGAVPEVNGKVVFADTIKTNHDASQIYKLVQEWNEKKVNNPEIKDYSSRVVYADSLQHEIVMQVEQRLVFNNSSFVYDYADAIFYLTFKIENKECILTIKNIKYKYSDQPKMITAEEMISDKEALNKDKTKLYKRIGKFRIATIDMVNDTFEEIEMFLNKDLYETIKKAYKERDVREQIVEEVVTPSNAVASVEASNSLAVPSPSLAPNVANITKQQGLKIASNGRDVSENILTQFTKEKAFAQSNFFIVGENIPYVKQVAEISVAEEGKQSTITCIVDTKGTMLSASQIMPSTRFKILYYAPKSNSYAKLAELSKKYAEGESFTEADITLIELLLENSNHAITCNNLKIEQSKLSMQVILK